MSVKVVESDVVDDIDAAIIRALQATPRAPFRVLAEVLDTSEQTVARRYRRMRRTGVLRVTAVVAGGPNNWVLRVQCKPGGAMAVARGLADRHDVGWVSLSGGGAEVTCVMRARSDASRDELLLRRLPGSAPVLGVSAAMLLHRFVSERNEDWIALTGELTDDQRARLQAATEPYFTPVDARAFQPPTNPQRDIVDNQLLDALVRDGRASFAELAAATGLTEGKAARRVHRLFADEHAYLDVDVSASALGFGTQALLSLTVAPGSLAAAGAALAAEREIPFVGAVTGTHNLSATIVCRDVDALYEFVTTRVGALPGVQAVEINPMLRVIKQAGALTAGGRLTDD